MEAVAVFYIPRVITFTLGTRLGPAARHWSVPRRLEAGSRSDNAGVDAVFVGTVLDVCDAGLGAIARFVVELAASGARAGEIVGVSLASGSASGPRRLTAGERWLIVAAPHRRAALRER
jgi:hypothetical protein